MDTSGAKGGGVAEQVSRGLGAGQADDQVDGRKWGRLAGGRKGEVDGSLVGVQQGGFSERAVDEAGVEVVSGGAAQHF
jgi:hypothetical protein